MKDQTKAQMIKLVRTLIDKNAENKQIGWRVEQTSHNQPITAGDCYNIIGAIPESLTGEGRIGDKIKPKSLVVRGCVGLDPLFQADTRPFYVRVIIATQKDIKVANGTLGNVDVAHLLRSSDVGAPEVPFTGNRLEMTYPVNDNKFRVYMDKTYLICPTSSASGFPLNKSQFVFTKVFSQLPANLSFDQGNGDYCNNFAPFIAIGYAYTNGSLPDPATTTRVSTSVHAQLTYEDS